MKIKVKIDEKGRCTERYGYKYDENQNIIINLKNLNSQLNHIGGKK